MNPLTRLIALATFAVILCGCGAQAEQGSHTRPPPVRLASPASFGAGPPLQAIGRIEANAEAALGFVVPGLLRDVRVDIGDRVRAGDLLARLDTTSADTALTQATEQADQAQRDLARIDTLVERNLLPRQQRDDVRTRVQVAAAALRDARFQRRHAEIRATVDGVVMARLSEPGEVLAAGQPVLRLASANSGWRLRAEVADRDALALSPGQTAEVSVDALPGRQFAARIREIGGVAAAGSAALTVDVDLLEVDPRLRSGLIARLRVVQADAGNLAVPVSALVAAQGDSAEVLLAANGIASRRSLRLGRLQGDVVEVLEGLEHDDLIIVAGAAWVDAGAAVRVIDAP